MIMVSKIGYNRLKLTFLTLFQTIMTADAIFKASVNINQIECAMGNYIATRNFSQSLFFVD